MEITIIAFAMASVMAAQVVKPPVPPPKPPAVTQKTPPAKLPPAPVLLMKATAVFQTNGAAKRAETLVSVYVLRKDGFVAAMKQSISISEQPKHIELETFTSVNKELGKVRVLILPKGEDIWRFNCTLYLHWSDKTVTPIAFDGVSLSERNPVFEAALSGG